MLKTIEELKESLAYLDSRPKRLKSWTDSYYTNLRIKTINMIKELEK